MDGGSRFLSASGEAGVNVPTSAPKLDFDQKKQSRDPATSFLQHFQPLSLFPNITTMFSRALRRGFAAPARRQAFAPSSLSSLRRAVTTDAASSHVEKEHVPEVQLHIAYG